MKIRPWDNPSNRVYKIILVLDSNGLYTECGTRSHEKALMKNSIHMTWKRRLCLVLRFSIDYLYNTKWIYDFLQFMYKLYSIQLLEHCTYFLYCKYTSMWAIHKLSHVHYIILFKKHVKIKNDLCQDVSQHFQHMCVRTISVQAIPHIQYRYYTILQGGLFDLPADKDPLWCRRLWCLSCRHRESRQPTA